MTLYAQWTPITYTVRFDPSDRFASAVLDTAPTADGSTGLAELADIAQDRGTIR